MAVPDRTPASPDQPAVPGARETVPAVSVVIPARDEEDYIEAALRSVAAQTRAGRIEAIVAANGCTDATVAVAEAFARHHPELPITVVDHEVPGISRAKNRGAALARGDVLVFLDADSRLAPDMIDQVIKRTERGMAAGSMKMRADSHDLLDRGFFALIEYGKRVFGIKANMLYCSRELFSEHGGFDESLNVAEDRNLLVRLQKAGVNVAHLTESWVATSPRRLHGLPLRLGMVTTLGRWAMAHGGVGRRWRY
jgi:glycosyltransferase involved in cell wall biosynthesis